MSVHLRVLGLDEPAAADVLGDLARLMNEYAESHGWHTEQHHIDEIATLPGEYAPPAGGAWVAYLDEGPIGCLVMRPATKWLANCAELRRLYVAPDARRLGVARALVESAEKAARAAGYESLVLVSLAQMEEAHALYASLRFEFTGAYRPTTLPVHDNVFMRKSL